MAALTRRMTTDLGMHIVRHPSRSRMTEHTEYMLAARQDARTARATTLPGLGDATFVFRLACDRSAWNAAPGGTPSAHPSLDTVEALDELALAAAGIGPEPDLDARGVVLAPIAFADNELALCREGLSCIA